jgi:hypothetical protein
MYKNFWRAREITSFFRKIWERVGGGLNDCLAVFYYPLLLLVNCCLAGVKASGVSIKFKRVRLDAVSFFFIYSRNNLEIASSSLPTVTLYTIGL